MGRRIRSGTPGLDEDPTPRMLRRRLREPEDFQISLQFSDGRTAISGRPRGDFEPTGPILQSRGGGGTSHSQLLQWWVWPLPPAGPLEFICQWPVYGIGETRVGIDGQLILDAARRSVRLSADLRRPFHLHVRRGHICDVGCSSYGGEALRWAAAARASTGSGRSGWRSGIPAPAISRLRRAASAGRSRPSAHS